MKKGKWKELCALICAAALLLTFAACGKEPEAQNTMTDSESQSETETLAPEESETQTDSSAPDQSDTAPVDGSQPQGEIQKPTDMVQGIALFNAAVKKVKSINATYSRTLDEANALNINLMDLGVAPEFDLDNQPLPNPSVTEIDASAVANYQLEEQGNNYILKFQLKDFSGDASSAHGAGGFMYFINFDETTTLVNKIAEKLSKGILKITMFEEGFSIQLTGGELVATIDKTSGVASKGTLSFTETVSGNVKSTIGKGDARIVGHGSGVFLFQ